MSSNLEVIVTPGKRRFHEIDNCTNDDIQLPKQQHHHQQQPQHQRRIPLKIDNFRKETNFILTAFMEEKSIADILNEKDLKQENPFEVIRKPPPNKKPKHNASKIEECCFTNSALNLNGPENFINPFEVKRDTIVSDDGMNGNGHHRNKCFSNSAFNLRVPEKDVCNPFEIVRADTAARSDKTEVTGIENPALDIQPTPLAIGIPFTPTVGCRIDFNDLPLEKLTPSTMLANKLVFSTPPLSRTLDDYDKMTTPKRSRNLSVITEEPPVDISQELDCYQLELENSINEAKSNKKKKSRNLMDMKNKSNFSLRLKKYEEESVSGIEIDSSNRCEDKLNVPETQRKHTELTFTLNDNNSSSKILLDFEYEEIDKDDTTNIESKKTDDKSIPDKIDTRNTSDNIVTDNKATIQNINDNQTSDSNDDERVEVDDDEDILFKNPTPFIRTFRRDNQNTGNPPIQQVGKDKKKLSEIGVAAGGIRNSIRKSIRKLMHKNDDQVIKPLVITNDENHDKGLNIFSTIRQSFRKKTTSTVSATSTPLVNKSNNGCNKIGNQIVNTTIIDDGTRKVFKAPIEPDDEYFVLGTIADDDDDDGIHFDKPKRIAPPMINRKSTLRSSLRRKTKDVRRQVLKSVFKQNIEGYCFERT